MKENGKEDPCEKNPLEVIETCSEIKKNCEGLCLRKDTIFIFIFLRLWACGLILLFFGLWVFCGSSSFFLEGTVGCNNF